MELTGTTGGRSALHLIRAIATVILAVAHKVPRDAAATGTCELVWSTGDVTWGQLGEESKMMQSTLSTSFLQHEHSFIATLHRLL